MMDSRGFAFALDSTPPRAALAALRDPAAVAASGYMQVRQSTQQPRAALEWP